jgi:hypothetical protein
MVKFASAHGQLGTESIETEGKRTSQKHQDYQSTYSNGPSEAEADFVQQPVERNGKYHSTNSSASHNDSRSKAITLIKVVPNDGQ